MTSFLLIDPALSCAFLKISNGSNNYEIVNSSSVTFWTDLNGLIQKSQEVIKDLVFFINFGPGSYTGLKQSKVLAEIFSSAGAEVRVFKQDYILKVHRFDKAFFCTPAYKNQYYFSKQIASGEVEHSLLDGMEWEKWLEDNLQVLNQLVIVDSKILQQPNVSVLSDLYAMINFNELTQISQKYDKQEIFYYRAITDDYKVSFNS